MISKIDAFAIIYYNDLCKNDPSKDDYDEAKKKQYKQSDIHKNQTDKIVPELMQVDFLAS